MPPPRFDRVDGDAELGGKASWLPRTPRTAIFEATPPPIWRSVPCGCAGDLLMTLSGGEMRSFSRWLARVRGGEPSAGLHAVKVVESRETVARHDDTHTRHQDLYRSQGVVKSAGSEFPTI